MRKKKYEKLLRRFCFAAACCLMLAGAAAPVTAFAAEPGASDTLIRAGTYRFNDVLTVASENMEQYIVFTTSPIISIVDNTIVVSDGSVSFNTMIVEGTYSAQLVYNGDVDFFSVYNGDNSYNWNYAAAVLSFAGVINAEAVSGYGQTITIPTDQEVSAEFYAWFTSNARPVGAAVDLEDIVTDSIRAPLSWVGSFLNALISGPLAPVFSVFAIAIAISLLFVVIVLIKRFIWGI